MISKGADFIRPVLCRVGWTGEGTQGLFDVPTPLQLSSRQGSNYYPDRQQEMADYFCPYPARQQGLIRAHHQGWGRFVNLCTNRPHATDFTHNSDTVQKSIFIFL